MSLCQSFQDASSTCHLHSAVSLGIHPGHRPFTPSGWRDSAGGADPTPGYHLQTWIAGAVSGTANTTNTQHGLTTLALGFPSPEAVSDPFFLAVSAPRCRARAGPGSLLSRWCCCFSCGRRSARTGRSDPLPSTSETGSGPQPGTLAMRSLISSTDLS